MGATFYDFTVFEDQWYRFTFNPITLQAGTTYQLWFKSLDVGGDRCTLFDAITLKIPEEEIGCWAIPNGDFELWATNFVKGFSLDNTNRVPGFTVEQGANFSEKVQSYSTFSVAGRDEWTYYNRPWSTGGKTQLYMTGAGAKLVTTFTPPAGKWCVQADMSAWCVTATSSQKSYGVDASVTIGGETTALGQISTSEHCLKARKWPTAFMADGQTPVTLTLTGVLTSPVCGHGILDVDGNGYAKFHIGYAAKR